MHLALILITYEELPTEIAHPLQVGKKKTGVINIWRLLRANPGFKRFAYYFIYILDTLKKYERSTQQFKENFILLQTVWGEQTH